MSHRQNSLVLEHRRPVLGTAGLRRFDWARSPAATLRVIRPPPARANGSLSPSARLTRSHNQQTKMNWAIPPQPHVCKKLEPRWATDFDLNG